MVLEEEIKLSSSALWSSLRDYYLQQGIQAWDAEVPFFITSNVFFAQNTARILIHYFLDLARLNKLDFSEPVYILELGAGMGQFSYYLLLELIKILKIKKYYPVLELLKITYVLTDLSPENIAFCQSHPQLGRLGGDNFSDNFLTVEFCVLDILAPNFEQNLPWVKNKKVLKNPLSVLGNYILDSLPQDLFCIKNNQLYEKLLTVEGHLDDLNKGALEKLKLKFSESLLNLETISLGSLDSKLDSKLDFKTAEILKFYLNSGLSEASFLIPTAGFNFLEKLLKISKSFSPFPNLLFLATDKGYSSLEDFEALGDPSFIQHGSFSLWVNFHALKLWTELTHGLSSAIPMNEGIKSGVFLWGEENFESLGALSQILDQRREELDLSDFFNFYQKTKKLSVGSGPEHAEFLLSFMRFSRWDPYIFLYLSKEIISKLGHSTADVISGFLDNIESMVQQVYILPYGPDLYLPIAIFLQSVCFYERAIELYILSDLSYGPSFLNQFNLALCYESLGWIEPALEKLNEALKFSKPEAQQKKIRDWIYQLNERNK